jgi:hypothetical protein
VSDEGGDDASGSGRIRHLSIGEGDYLSTIETIDFIKYLDIQNMTSHDGLYDLQ